MRISKQAYTYDESAEVVIEKDDAIPLRLTKKQQELIVKMQSIAAELEVNAIRNGGTYGRIHVEDFTSYDPNITRRHLQIVFGSLDRAMRVAGLHPSTPTEEELLEIIQCFIEQNGRSPGPTDAREGRLLYSSCLYEKKFGSIAKAVRKSGNAPLGRGASTNPTHHKSLMDAKPVVWHCKSVCYSG